MHQIHQTAVEGQGAHICAELSKKVFIPSCEGIGLFPKVKGGEDVGGDTDIRRCHVLDGDWSTDGGRHPAAPHTAST